MWLPRETYTVVSERRVSVEVRHSLTEKSLEKLFSYIFFENQMLPSAEWSWKEHSATPPLTATGTGPDFRLRSITAAPCEDVTQQLLVAGQEVSLRASF